MAHRLPCPLLAERPGSLEGVFLDVRWGLERLHAIAVPALAPTVGSSRF